MKIEEFEEIKNLINSSKPIKNHFIMRKEQKEKAVFLKSSGMTAKQISHIVGVSQQTLCRWFKPLKDELQAQTKLREHLKLELLKQSEVQNPNLKEIKRLIKLIKGLKSL